MAVVLPDGLYQVARRPHPAARDADGRPVAGPEALPGVLRPGAAELQSDGSWAGRLDPAEWPLLAGDVLYGPAGLRLTVTGIPVFARNWACSDVDHVAYTAVQDPPPVK